MSTYFLQRRAGGTSVGSAQRGVAVVMSTYSLQRQTSQTSARPARRGVGVAEALPLTSCHAERAVVSVIRTARGEGGGVRRRTLCTPKGANVSGIPHGECGDCGGAVDLLSATPNGLASVRSPWHGVGAPSTYYLQRRTGRRSGRSAQRGVEVQRCCSVSNGPGQAAINKA